MGNNEKHWKGRFIREVYENRPWYHDFSRLGIQTDFTNYLPKWIRFKNGISSLLGANITGLNLRGENYLRNQGCKELWLFPFLTKAFELAGARRASFLELFCADGYYSFWVKNQFNTKKIVGVDKNNEDIKRCLLIKRILNHRDTEFIPEDVCNLSERQKYDIVLNAGGLYHLEDPLKLIKLSYEITNKYMVLQTVTTLETESKDYFVTPAPGWKHGCRFTDAWLVHRLKEVGWRILESARNILGGNERPCDKGSSYFLLEKT